jgi:hypothetical protein
VEECSRAEQGRAGQEGQWEQLLLVWFKERGFGRLRCARLVINSYFLCDGVLRSGSNYSAGGTFEVQVVEWSKKSAGGGAGCISRVPSIPSLRAVVQ